MDKKAFLVLFAVLALSVSVSAVPGIPHRFYGTANFSNVAAPDNFVVSAKIEGAEIANTAVLNGGYGYEGELLFVTDPYNSRAGKTVEFFVSGVKANETAVFQNGGSQRLDLTVNALVNELVTSEAIENKTVAVGPNSLFAIGFGDSLDIIVSSSTETTATIEEVSELSEGFFAERPAPGGLRALKGYEIRISGNASSAIAIHYRDTLTGIEEESIAPYKFAGAEWEKIEPFTQNKINKTINFTVSGATPYAIMGSQKVETSPCEGIECNDFNPCTLDECREGTCAYTALPNGIACPNGACRNGFCETVEEQQDESTQTTEEETQQTQPPGESETGGETQQTEGGETTGERAGETGNGVEETKEGEESKTPTALFTFEANESTAVMVFIAIILTFVASYFLFRRK